MLFPSSPRRWSNATAPAWRTRPSASPPCWWDQSTETRSTRRTGRRSRRWFGGSPGTRRLFLSPPTTLCCAWTWAAFCVQAAGHVGAGGGDDPVSLLRLPAASERAAVHLLQEQPALLHHHGNLALLHPSRSAGIYVKNSVISVTFSLFEVFSFFFLPWKKNNVSVCWYFYFPKSWDSVVYHSVSCSCIRKWVLGCFLGLKKHGLFKAFFVFDTLQFVGGRRQSTADSVPWTLLASPCTLFCHPMFSFQGRHMLKEDWSACPHCEFPALYSQFIL